MPATEPQPEVTASKTLSEIWDLTSDDLKFELTKYANYPIAKHEQLHISYGKRANSYLLVEYGFAIPDNPYDFVRINSVNLNTFGLPPPSCDLSTAEAGGLKPEIRADLKKAGLNRDVL